MKKIFLVVFAMGLMQIGFAQSKGNVKFKAPVIKKTKAKKIYNDEIVASPLPPVPAAPPLAVPPPPPPPPRNHNAKTRKVKFTTPTIVKMR